MEDERANDSTSRRDLLRLAGVGAVTWGLGAGIASSEAATASTPAPSGAAKTRATGGPYNILFILTDQERFFRPGELPVGYSLPAHERLQKQGTTFVNHRINSCVCTPSRSVLYTGRHIQQTGMFDNTNFPWIKSMSPDIRTMGDLLRDAGYYTAYKGKWHLTKEFETVNTLAEPSRIFTQEMEAYGFSDYFGIGDIIAHTQGGYLHDGVISAMGVSWLRGKGRELAAEGKPWFLAVNLVNPHDVMFYDTDAPGTPVESHRGLAHVARDPVDPLYAKKWQFTLAANHFQPIDAPGRPACHYDFLRSHDAMVGDDPERGSALAPAPQLLPELPARRRSQHSDRPRRARCVGTRRADDRRPHCGSRRHGRRASAPCQGRCGLSRAEPRAADRRSSCLPRRQAVPCGHLAPRYRANAGRD